MNARLFFGGLVLAATLAAQPGVVTETVISDDVVIIKGRVANLVAVRTDAGLVIVDSLLSPLHARLARALLTDRFPHSPVRYLISTHYHPDHNFGNQEFAEATLISHPRAAARAPATQATADEFLRAPQELERLHDRLDSGGEAGSDHLSQLRLWETRLARYSGFRRRSADLLVAGELTLRLGGKTISIRHLGAGHTDGDLVVLFEEDGVLATGDLVFHHIVPVIDLDGGVDIRGWAAALRALLATTPAVRHVVPGHGLPGGIELLQEQADFIDDVVKAIDDARRQRLPLTEAGHLAGLERYSSYEEMFGTIADVVAACRQLLD